MRTILLFCTLILGLMASGAEARLLSANLVREPQSLLPYFSWLPDADGSLTIESISSGSLEERFAPLADGIPLKGSGPVWIRLAMLKQTAGGAELAPAESSRLIMNLGALPPGGARLYISQSPGPIDAEGVWHGEDVASHEPVLLPEPGLLPMSVYIRLAEMPGLWFSPTVAPQNATAPDLLPWELILPGLMIAAAIACLLRALAEKAAWAVWAAAFLGCCLAQAVLPLPALSQGLRFAALPSLMAPGLALILLPHVGRCMFRTDRGEPLKDALLYLCSFAGLLLALAPLLPGFQWLTRLFPLWPLLLAPLLPLCAALSGRPGALAYAGACFMPVLGAAASLYALKDPLLHPLAAQGSLWGLALGGIGLALARVPAPEQEPEEQTPGLTLAATAADEARARAEGHGLHLADTAAFAAQSQYDELPPLPVEQTGGADIAPETKSDQQTDGNGEAHAVPDADAENEARILPDAAAAIETAAEGAAHALPESLYLPEAQGVAGARGMDTLAVPIQPPAQEEEATALAAERPATDAATDPATAPKTDLEAAPATTPEAAPAIGPAAGLASEDAAKDAAADPALLPSDAADTADQPCAGAAGPDEVPCAANTGELPGAAAEIPPADDFEAMPGARILVLEDDTPDAGPDEAADMLAGRAGPGLRTVRVSSALLPDFAGDSSVEEPISDAGYRLISLEDDDFSAFIPQPSGQQPDTPHDDMDDFSPNAPARTTSLTEDGLYLFSLHSLVRDVHDIVEPLAKARGLIFSWYIAPTLPSLLEGDAPRLRGALSLLLQSAVRATAKGAVQLSVRKAPGATDPGELLFIISDNGSAKRTDAGFFHAWELAARTGGSFTVDYSPASGTQISFTARFALPSEQAAQDHLARYPLDDDSDSLEDALQAPLYAAAHEPAPAMRPGPAYGSAPLPDPDAGFKDLASLPAPDEDPVPVLHTVTTTNFATATHAAQGARAAHTAHVDARPAPHTPQDPHGAEYESAWLAAISPEQVLADQIAAVRKSLAVDRATEPQHSPEAAELSVSGQSAAQQRMPEEQRAAEQRPPVVLVAEMTTSNRRLLASYLADVPHEHLNAESNHEVLHYAQGGNVSLIIFDADMPEPDIIRTITELRQTESRRDTRTPILVLTSHTAQAARMLEAGASYTLGKPYRKQSLLDMVALAIPALTQRLLSGFEQTAPAAAARPQQGMPAAQARASATTLTTASPLAGPEALLPSFSLAETFTATPRIPATEREVDLLAEALKNAPAPAAITREVSLPPRYQPENGQPAARHDDEAAAISIPAEPRPAAAPAAPDDHGPVAAPFLMGLSSEDVTPVAPPGGAANALAASGGSLLDFVLPDSMLPAADEEPETVSLGIAPVADEKPEAASRAISPAADEEPATAPPVNERRPGGETYAVSPAAEKAPETPAAGIAATRTEAAPQGEAEEVTPQREAEEAEEAAVLTPKAAEAAPDYTVVAAREGGVQRAAAAPEQEPRAQTPDLVQPAAATPAGIANGGKDTAAPAKVIKPPRVVVTIGQVRKRPEEAATAQDMQPTPATQTAQPTGTPPTAETDAAAPMAPVEKAAAPSAPAAPSAEDVAASAAPLPEETAAVPAPEETAAAPATNRGDQSAPAPANFFALPGIEGEGLDPEALPLIPGLLHTLEDALSDILAARDQGNSILVQEAAARLAGKAEHFDLARLGKFARCVERAAEAGDMEAVQTLLEDLAPVTRRYMAALDQCFKAFLNFDR